MLFYELSCASLTWNRQTTFVWSCAFQKYSSWFFAISISLKCYSYIHLCYVFVLVYGKEYSWSGILLGFYWSVLLIIFLLKNVIFDAFGTIFYLLHFHPICSSFLTLRIHRRLFLLTLFVVLDYDFEWVYFIWFKFMPMFLYLFFLKDVLLVQGKK